MAGPRQMGLIVISEQEVDRARQELVAATGAPPITLLSTEVEKLDMPGTRFFLCCRSFPPSAWERIVEERQTYTGEGFVLDCTDLDPWAELQARGYRPKTLTGDFAPFVNLLRDAAGL